MVKCPSQDLTNILDRSWFIVQVTHNKRTHHTWTIEWTNCFDWLMAGVGVIWLAEAWWRRDKHSLSLVDTEEFSHFPIGTSTSKTFSLVMNDIVRNILIGLNKYMKADWRTENTSTPLVERKATKLLLAGLRWSLP